MPYIKLGRLWIAAIFLCLLVYYGDRISQTLKSEIHWKKWKESRSRLINTWGPNTTSTGTLWITTKSKYITSFPESSSTDNHCFPVTEETDTVTSAKYSSFSIVNKPRYGQYLRVRIDARSGLNCSLTEGGDFWFAVLSSLDTTGSTSAPVVDHHNGTYTVDLYVAWKGHVDVNVTLVHPSLAVKYLDYVTNISDFSKIYWKGTFKASDSPDKTQTTSCYMSYHGPKSWQDKCAYPQIKALGNNTAWVCEKPSGLACDDLVEYITDGDKTDAMLQKLNEDSGMGWLFDSNHFRQRLFIGPQTLRVLTDQLDIANNSIKMTENSLNHVHLGEGFWQEDIWNTFSNITLRQWKNSSEVGRCLQNKNLFLLGDSTTRQWTMKLLSLIYNIPYDKRSFYTYSNFIKEYNLNFTFYFHPQVIGSHGIPIWVGKYEVDVLDSFQNHECNYVVTISPWAHFAQWWLPAYEERLRLIREAIVRFRQRCPNAPIIIKSPHTRNPDKTTQEYQLMASDYILFKIKLLMEKYLNIKGVYYIDIWYMNLAYPVEKDVHMPEEVITQEVNLFLSSICPNESEEEHFLK